MSPTPRPTMPRSSPAPPSPSASRWPDGVDSRLAELVTGATTAHPDSESGYTAPTRTKHDSQAGDGRCPDARNHRDGAGGAVLRGAPGRAAMPVLQPGRLQQ